MGGTCRQAAQIRGDTLRRQSGGRHCEKGGRGHTRKIKGKDGNTRIEAEGAGQGQGLLTTLPIEQ